MGCGYHQGQEWTKGPHSTCGGERGAPTTGRGALSGRSRSTGRSRVRRVGNTEVSGGACRLTSIRPTRGDRRPGPGVRRPSPFTPSPLRTATSSQGASTPTYPRTWRVVCGPRPRTGPSAVTMVGRSDPGVATLSRVRVPPSGATTPGKRGSPERASTRPGPTDTTTIVHPTPRVDTGPPLRRRGDRPGRRPLTLSRRDSTGTTSVSRV